MHALKVALIQLEVATGQPDRNLNRARQLLSQVKERGAQLAVLPELWTTGCDFEHVSQYGSLINEGVFGQIANLASEFEVYLCGSTLEARGGQYFNTQTVYSPDGQLLGAYSKIHLFGLMREPDFLTPGNKLVKVELPWGKAGLAICYDLRFPEMFRSYTLAGTQLILLSAEWPQPRLEPWRTLVRARAIENQSLVVACNCVGESNGSVFFGHSLVVDPWGEVLVEGGEQEEVLVAELDLARVDDIRERFPVLADRRAGLYSLP